MTLLILFVAHNITDIGQTGQNTGAVRVAQAALDAKALAGFGVDIVVGKIFLTQRLHRVGIQSCHFRMRKIHG